MAIWSVSILFVVCYFGHTTTGQRSANLQVQRLTSASSKFSQRLYQEVAVGQPNAIFSPYSAHACLSMAYMGARGTTAEQMKSTLQLSSLASPHTVYKDLIEDLNSVERVQLLTANAIYIKPGFTVNRRYKNMVMSNYHAISDNIDMSAPGGPEAPINAWVANKTMNKITDVLQPGFITRDTAMILLNTIFFNGTWAFQFEEYMTRQASFTKADSSSSQVDLMRMTKFLPLKEEAIPGVDVLSLPFSNSRFSLIVALPRSVNGLSGLESYITGSPSNVDALFEGLERRYVEVFLPKFKLTATMSLNQALSNMGMSVAFTNGADLSGISRSSLMISDVVQKATIEVTEKGTVAAAATAISIMLTSAQIYPQEPFVFKADHPFLYFLRDSESGQILFQGKLEDPDITEFQVQ